MTFYWQILYWNNQNSRLLDRRISFCIWTCLYSIKHIWNLWNKSDQSSTLVLKIGITVKHRQNIIKCCFFIKRKQVHHNLTASSGQYNSKTVHETAWLTSQYPATSRQNQLIRIWDWCVLNSCTIVWPAGGRCHNRHVLKLVSKCACYVGRPRCDTLPDPHLLLLYVIVDMAMSPDWGAVCTT